MVIIGKNGSDKIAGLVGRLENMEKDKHKIPLIFAEIFKDEINAADEYKMYNGFKRVIKKYSEDGKAFSIIDEFARVITGGSSLEQIIQITMDEAVHPSAESQLTVDAVEVFEER